MGQARDRPTHFPLAFLSLYPLCPHPSRSSLEEGEWSLRHLLQTRSPSSSSSSSSSPDIAQPGSAIDAEILRRRLEIRLQVAAIPIALAIIISTTLVEQAHPHDHHAIRALPWRCPVTRLPQMAQKERRITAPESDDWVSSNVLRAGR
ncbi:hypothetical protein PG984_000337 [Apiospora sp. TS-2023a]